MSFHPWWWMEHHQINRNMRRPGFWFSWHGLGMNLPKGASAIKPSAFPRIIWWKRHPFPCRGHGPTMSHRPTNELLEICSKITRMPMFWAWTEHVQSTSAGPKLPLYEDEMPKTVKHCQTPTTINSILSWATGCVVFSTVFFSHTLCMASCLLIGSTCMAILTYFFRYRRALPHLGCPSCIQVGFFAANVDRQQWYLYYMWCIVFTIYIYIYLLVVQ